MSRILIIEDNIDLAENIADFLEAKGHIMDFATDGIDGLHRTLTETYDVIILDLMLPGMDGLTLCRKLRKEADKYTPVLMLTARDTLEDKLTGFDSGADDYLVKPFALQELAARVNALRNRYGIGSKTLLHIADVVLDLRTLSIQRAGKTIELNRICLNIIRTLMQAWPKVVSRRDLEFYLWGDTPPDSDALRSHVYALRQKIDKPFSIPLIQTVHGIGYKIRSEDEIS